MNIKIAPILVIIFFSLSSFAVYSQDKAILKLADEYSLALKKYQSQKMRISMESVVRKGMTVAEKLDEMESLSDADYSLLEKKMKGFVINREEIVFVEPDLKFFSSLAKTHGTKADIAFFSLMREIRPGNVWPAYIEQQTDVTGCTIYGTGVLTRLYGKSLQFKKIHPRAYLPEINEEIDSILEEFTIGTCACAGRNGVVKEFQLFIKTFPKDKNTPLIKVRLLNLEKNRDFRFNCQSG